MTRLFTICFVVLCLFGCGVFPKAKGGESTITDSEVGEVDTGAEAKEKSPTGESSSGNVSQDIAYKELDENVARIAIVSMLFIISLVLAAAVMDGPSDIRARIALWIMSGICFVSSLVAVFAFFG